VLALIYQTSQNGLCSAFQEDLQTATNSKDNCVISYKEEVVVNGEVDGANNINADIFKSKYVKIYF